MKIFAGLIPHSGKGLLKICPNIFVKYRKHLNAAISKSKSQTRTEKSLASMYNTSYDMHRNFRLSQWNHWPNEGNDTIAEKMLF